MALVGFCKKCMHPITFDGVFGWLHKDFAPDGRSFRHNAQPIPESVRSDHVANGGREAGDG